MLRVAVQLATEEDEAVVDPPSQPPGTPPTPVWRHSSLSWICIVAPAAACTCRNRTPDGFWLQVEGCPNGPSWVLAEYAPDDAILLSKGWKAFARSRRLSKGQFLAFQFDGDQTLLVKIYRAAGGRIECWLSWPQLQLLRRG